RVNDEGEARLRRDWDRLPPVPDAGPPDHPYARDLDIFGHGSVARLLATTGTTPGRQRLHRWLLEPAPADEVPSRQAAVEELAGQLDYRQQIQVSGRLAGDPEPAALEAFVEWAESGPWLVRRKVLLWTARLVPLATAVLAVLQARGVVARPWWLVTLVLGGALAARFGGRLHRHMAGASLGDAGMQHYAELVGRIQEADARSPMLRSIRDDLNTDCDARRELERLGWLTGLAELRHGGVFYVLINLPTLWDFHVLAALERWKARAGRHVRSWGDAVARLDALCALGAPLHDEPGWSFPELAGTGNPGTDDPGADDPADDPGADGARLVARGLAHPLLAPGERVANDVTVGPPGTFLMVTGSNMSGKSTLLRAIGVNAVLAQAGGPVCARSLRCPALTVRTSMRVEDSLERGVSLFMAELQRLKGVVDAADSRVDDPDDGGDAPHRILLYLLDEVLHGTNSAERQVAIREVLAHLLRRPAIGAISTHDLDLAEADPLASAAVAVHFRETVHPEGHDPPMSFDYRLREGIATSTNALKLVRLVGLADPGSEP
ncbi:MAG: MutS-related protein, partial [Gemmatimonadota bacterium]